MQKLLKFETKKLLKTKSFYICIIISSLFVVLHMLVSKSFMKIEELNLEYTSYNLIKQYVSSGMLIMMLGIFVALFVCDDASNNTLKNIYAKGYTRAEVYLSKYIVTMFGGVILNIVVLGCSACFGNLWFASGVRGDNFYVSFLVQISITLCYSTLFFIIAMLSDKVGMSIAFSIIGPSVVSLGFSLIDTFLKLPDRNISDYWLDNLLSNLEKPAVTTHDLLQAGMVSVVLIVAVTMIGMILNHKKEI